MRGWLRHSLLAGLAAGALLLTACGGSEVVARGAGASVGVGFDTTALLRAADSLAALAPHTVTAFPAERSAGGPHDYYSEGRYWWPNPDDPDGPYVRRDGESFPGLFLDHRRALADLSATVSACAAAYLATGEPRYGAAVRRHAVAWFVDTATLMHPRLTYAQAIKGITEGRGIGIIDTRSLLYVARAVELLGERGGVFVDGELAAVRAWFGAYGDWLVTSQHGRDERDNGNNHGTWWGAQLAAYARAARRPNLLDTAQTQYRRELARQMDVRGVFPDEVGRTRPFHYTEYNLDGFATLAHLASTPSEDLWAYRGPTGTLCQALDWYLGYRTRLDEWPYPADLEPAPRYEAADYLYLAALHYGDAAYAKTYRELAAEHPPADAAELAILTWPRTSPLDL